MASQGPNATGTVANNTGVGTKIWSSYSNATTSNNVYTIASSFNVGTTSTSNYLKATNFGFSITSGATIDGVVVEIERKCNVNTGSNFIKDNIISLVKGGTVSGNNNADTVTKWSTTEAFFTYGSSSDLWGLSLTDSDINASTFGVVLSVNGTRAGKTNPTASVDFIRITVYYTIGGGGGSTSSSMPMVGD